MQESNTLYIPPLLPYGRGYTVLFEASSEGLPSELWKELGTLYEKIETEPLQALEKLKNLCAQFPHIHTLANLRVFALLRLKKKKEAEKLIKKMFNDFPQSLTAKINFADLCLRKKQTDAIPVIFEEKFDLNTLYPEKTSYHFAEFRGFMLIMGRYHLQIAKKDKAQEYFELAFLVDPLHPGVVSLEKLIKKTPSLLQKLAHFIKKT